MVQEEHAMIAILFNTLVYQRRQGRSLKGLVNIMPLLLLSPIELMPYGDYLMTSLYNHIILSS